MGKIWMTGGASTDLDPVNAESWQILQNRVIVDKNGNPLTGTMPDRAAIKPIINAGERFPIPEGYHNGLGGVTANSLAAQTPGNALAAHILSPYVAWSNGVRIPGNIATMGAQTISPTSYQQTVQTSGKFLSGNVTVNAVTNLRPENVKKGVSIGDVTGVWEGWVPTASDLYLYGNNIAGWGTANGGNGNMRLDSGQLTYGLNPDSPGWGDRSFSMRTSGSYNMAGYTRVVVEGLMEFNTGLTSGGGYTYVEYTPNGGTTWTELGRKFLELAQYNGPYSIIEVPLTPQSVTLPIRIRFSVSAATVYGVKGYITRIRMY